MDDAERAAAMHRAAEDTEPHRAPSPPADAASPASMIFRHASQDPGASHPSTGRSSSHPDTAVADSQQPRPHGQQYRAEYLSLSFGLQQAAPTHRCASSGAANRK